MSKTLKLLAVFCCVISSTAVIAEGCPNLKDISFSSLSEYQNYTNEVSSKYIMPDMSAWADRFPIRFGSYNYATMHKEGGINREAPFKGDKVVCNINWSHKYYGGKDADIIIYGNIQSSSQDWFYDKVQASCYFGLGISCPFKKI